MCVYGDDNMFESWHIKQKGTISWMLFIKMWNMVQDSGSIEYSIHNT